MAGVPGHFQPLTDTFVDAATTPGIGIGQGRAVGRDTRLNPTDLEPQFADPFVSGRPVNLQTIQLPYNPPEQRVTRAPRMPRAFGIGIIRWESVAEWPFLPGMRRPRVANWVGMTGARIPRMGFGWGEPRKDIVSQSGVPYGDVSQLYPHVYATAIEVV